MSNVFTLDSLRQETERKFAPVKIGLSDGSQVEMLSILRLGKKSRDSVLATIEDMRSISNDETAADELTDEENELLIESISDIFRTIVASKADKLLAELDGDDLLVKISLMMSVLTTWLEGAQVGEARNSPS
jgi:Zn-finger domain-containing protein